MSLPYKFSVLLPLLVVLHLSVAGASVVVKPVVLRDPVGPCLSQERREAIIQTFKVSVQATLEVTYSKNPNCGPGPWVRVAYLNMTDPSQHCPSAWREDNSNGVRFCRRPVTSSGSCPGTSYITGRWYSKVCGRAIGYQIGSTDAFGFRATNQIIDSYYVYGVSITHGLPRNHIWTFAAGLSEDDGWGQQNCPCINPSYPNNQFPPSFVGDHYYCESGNPKNEYDWGAIFSNDPLWDGKQCEGQCCSNGKSPPWFSVDLSNPTTDDIEVHICSGDYGDVGLQLLEIYVQ